jgi:hypothetical protein
MVPSLKKYLPLICTILSFVFIILIFIHPVSGNDIWFHLRLGQEIWKNQSIPRWDYHSFTSSGISYINQSWLAQLIFFGIYQVSGFLGLQILHILLISLTFLFIILISRPKNIHLTLLLIAILFPLALKLDEIRPYYFTWVFLSLEVYLIHKRKLFLLPLIFLFWANLHNGFLLGIGLLLFYSLKEYFSTKKFNFLLLFLLSLLTSFFTPYGPKIYLYPLTQGRSPELLYINEWQPFAVTSIFFWIYFVYIITLIIACFKQKLFKTNLFELIFIITISIFGYSSQRHSFIIALVLVPFYIQYLGPFFQKFKNPSYLIACIIPIFFFFANRCSYNLTRFTQIDNTAVPYYGVKFLLDHQITGQVFNHYGFGGYLLWANPSQKVFIDSRQEIYPGQPTLEFMAVISSSPIWNDILNKYQINYIIIRPDQKLNQVLLNHPDWDLVYFDSTSIIYLRHGTFPEIPRLQNITPNGSRRPQDFSLNITEYKYLLTQNPEFCYGYQSIAGNYLNQNNSDQTKIYLAQLIDHCPLWKHNPSVIQMQMFIPQIVF